MWAFACLNYTVTANESQHTGAQKGERELDTAAHSLWLFGYLVFCTHNAWLRRWPTPHDPSQRPHFCISILCSLCDFLAAAPLAQSGNAVVAPQPTPGRAFVCLVAASTPLGTGRARAMVSEAFFSPLERRNLDRWRFGILLHICDGRHLK